MRRVFLLTALFVVIFTGCNSMRSIKEEVMISHLDEEQALKLRNEAVERYYIVFGEGGTECSSSINERLVEDEDYYYYFCNDLDTREKIKMFLQKSYSENIARELIDTDGIKIMNTKLAFRPSDIGSMLEWDNAQIIKMIDDPNHSNSTIVEFRVPDVDGEFETISIEYKFTRNEGWRINSLPIVFL